EDIFMGSLAYLERAMTGGKDAAALYTEILRMRFNHPAGGTFRMKRLKGDKGEVALYCGTSEGPFGLIYVGGAKELCDHVQTLVVEQQAPIEVHASDFADGLFDRVKESSSPVNVLIGSKKFIEGWDCWRVSSLGLMHIAKK